ncbi:carboxypeptidase-like regulatory domain-containing protein [Niabella insulamsoli]|uniref:carboxypeptidase-like regulatory domain-containing protein n=1 Tax=Niabella insulamsoli TaxID=3144874 RepID=UPI0031FBA7AE
MRILLLFVFFVSAALANAQHRLSGTLLEAPSNQPIQGSSVFITGTSLAAISDKNGFFEIKNIPDGTYTLVFSHVGYKTITYDFSTQKMPPKLKVLMSIQEVMLENVVVGGYEKETWEKWGRTFLDYFVGSSANADQVSIANKDVISFRFYKKQNRLEVVAHEPINIINKALGYEIGYELEKFEINFKERTSFFSGYTLFSELKGNNRQKKRWQEKRQLAYLGSMMHFFRTAYHGDMAAEGFEVRRVRKNRNTEKDRVRMIFDIPLKRKMISVDHITGDSADYYRSVLQQPDVLLEFGPDLLPADSFMITHEGARYASWPHYLQIVNKHKIEEKKYLEFYGENRNVFPARSLISLQHVNGLVIDPNGNWAPAEGIMSEWYWSWSEKIANMLPANYQR